MTNENDEEQFLAPLREHPEDLHTWGVYADWLEEHGNRPATAEMIRSHVKENQKRDNAGVSRVDSFLFQGRPRTRIVNATKYPNGDINADHDLITTLIPSGYGGHVFYLIGWLSRPKSKRLIPALHKEGIDSTLPQDADTHDIEQRHRWDSDIKTTPEVHQMSRDKPLVVSYRRNSVKKYTISTVGRVGGHGQYSSEMAKPIVGSRLATVLHEIKGSIGKSNPTLQKLTQHALGGSHKPEVYTGIRDELFKTKDPRAVQLARQYNWHKVGEGLGRDRHLREFVVNSAKGTHHENHPQMFRKFYNGIVHGKNGPDNRVRAAFYQAMTKHLRDRTGKEHSSEEIQDSLRRLGETEENLEKLSGKNPRSKFELPDYPSPAYTGIPKEGKAPPKRQITPSDKRGPGQFKRNRFGFKI